MPKIEMNLADYLRVIRKRKRIIILSFLFMIISTAYYTSQQTPLYRTSCKVKIEQRKSVAEILTELVTWSPADEMMSQANLVGSFQTLEKVAERLSLINPGMKPAERMARVKGLQGQIEAEQIEYTNMIEITAFSTNPQRAVDIANTIAEVYVENHFENKKKEASNVRKFIKIQLDNYLTELENSELALQSFRQENPMVEEMDINNTPFQNNSLIMSLEEEIVKLDLELASLESRYTAEHPDVRILGQKLEKAKKDLSDRLSQLTGRQKELSIKEIELVQLRRNVTVAEDIYLMFKKKYEEARIFEAEKAQDVTIVDPALLPSGPIKPNINFNIMIGLFSGLLIGLIMAFVIESLDTTVGRLDDIEELLKVPVIGVIPNTSLEKRKKRFTNIIRKKTKKISMEGSIHERLVSLFAPSSIAAEAYRTLRTQLELTGLLKNAGNSIVVTSAAPEEGKTQTLCNLAIVMAQSGQKVLIIGSDFRKPAIYKLFGFKRSPGLADVLIGKISWKKAINTATDMLLGGLEYEQVLKTQGIENLSILTCGERAPNPAELLNFPEMSDLIQELKLNFDIILLDSPPTIPVTDSAILGDKTDGIILVYQAGSTSRHALLRAKIQLEHVGIKIKGVVINNLKAQYIEDVTPYQKYRYYGYYREKDKETS